MTLKTPNDFIYALDERIFKDVGLDLTFCFTEIDEINIEQVERGVCGVARNYLEEFGRIGPIVPYGLMVRYNSDTNMQQLLDASFFEVVTHKIFNECVEIGVYKQKKGDKEILSVGISSDILNFDVQHKELQRTSEKQIPSIDLKESVLTSGIREMNKLIQFGKHVPVSENINYRMLGMMRDGIKKPDYKGAAHICVPYMVLLDKGVTPTFKDPNYEFMGWFNSAELSTLVNVKEVFLEVYPDQSLETLHFSNPSYEQKLRPLLQYEFENWSKELFKTEDISRSILETTKTLLNPQGE